MRVLILSQYCWPEVDHKCLPLAKAIIAAGFEAEILTGYPNRPIGKLYPGYKMRLKYAEYIEGVKVNRVPSYLDHSRSGLKRMLSYLTFAISASFIGAFLVKKPNVIFAYHAPATIAIPAIFLKFIFRSKIFYDINDYWPDTISALGMLKNKFLFKILAAYCKGTYRYFDIINVVSKGYKRKLLELGVPNDKISLIYNWSLPIDNIKSSHFVKYSDIFKDNFIILYAGNIGLAQSLEIILDVAIQLRANNINGIKFFIVGSGVDQEILQKQVVEHRLGEYIFFTGFIPSDNVGEFLESADVLLLHLKREPLFNITIPSKLVTYFICSKPVLCGVGGEAAEIVEEANAGLCFEPENASDLYNKALAFRDYDKGTLERMGKAGRLVYDSLFSFEKGTNLMMNEFYKLYKRD